MQTITAVASAFLGGGVTAFLGGYNLERRQRLTPTTLTWDRFKSSLTRWMS